MRKVCDVAPFGHSVLYALPSADVCSASQMKTLNLLETYGMHDLLDQWSAGNAFTLVRGYAEHR